MRNLLLTLIFGLLAFAGFSQIQLVGNITTFGGGSYPTHIDSLGYGGLTVVADATERDAITQLRRKIGMVVFQVDESRLYYLDAPITENNWVPIETGVTAIDTTQTTIYCPAHGLDLTDYEGEFLPMFGCRGAQADHIDSLQTYYAVSIPDADSITIIASGLIYRPNHDLADFIGKIVYLTNTVGVYDTIQGTVLSAIAVVIDSNYIDLLPRSVLESENGLFVLPLPASFLNAYMGDSRVPQDTAVQRIARLYANVGLLRAGGKVITQSSAISDNPIYTSTGANPVNPGMSWTWTGGVNGRVIKDKELIVAIDLADDTYGGLNITPLDTVVLVGGVPTDTTVFNWLEDNVTNNKLRLPNGSLLYFGGTRQNPNYIWMVMDDISGNVSGSTKWSRLIKRIKEPGGSLVGRDTMYVSGDTLFHTNVYGETTSFKFVYSLAPDSIAVNDNILSFYRRGSGTPQNVTLPDTTPPLVEITATSSTTIELDEAEVYEIDLNGLDDCTLTWGSIVSGKQHKIHLLNGGSTTLTLPGNTLLLKQDGEVCSLSPIVNKSNNLIEGYTNSSLFYVTNSTVPLTCMAVNTGYQAVLDYATSQGYTKPSLEDQLYQSQLIDSLQAHGIWDSLDVFYNFYTSSVADSNFTKINWKDPTGDDNISAVNATFAALTGWSGNGSTSYLNTNWNPSTEGLAFSLNTASFGAWVVGNTGSSSKFNVGISGIRIEENPSGRKYQINSTAEATTTGGSTAGLWHVNRSGSATTNAYLNGSSVHSGTLSSTSVGNAPMFLMSYNLGGSPFGSTVSSIKYRFVFAGGDLSTKASQLSTILTAYVALIN